MSKPFFSYSPEEGLSFHDTEEEEARAAAQSELEHERDNAGDGWNEEVEEIFYGRVIAGVEKTFSAPACEYYGCEPGEDCDHEFDEVWDFGLVEVKHHERD